MIAPVLPPDLLRQVLDNILENFPDHNDAMDCVDWKYKAGVYHFQDEEGLRLFCRDIEGVKAFERMFTLMDGKLPWSPPCPTTADPDAWDDWTCQSDATTFNIFVQLGLYGKIVY